MKPQAQTKQKDKKQVTTEFPGHYYEKHEAGITRRQVDELLSQQYYYLLKKLKEGVAYKAGLSLTDDQAMETVHTAIAATVKQYEKNPGAFESQRNLFAYLLLSSWRSFRNANQKACKQRKTHWDAEVMDELGELVDTDAADETQESDFQELLRDEDFAAFVHERVYDYLDDSYLDGAFTLREISIFKIYCVHNYSIEQMVAETAFGRTAITKALSKIKKHLATVDFRWHQYGREQSGNSELI